MQTKKKFTKASENISFDLEHRRKLNFNIGKYAAAVVKGKKQYADLELAKQKASKIKTDVLNNLDKYLLEFEENAIKNGIKVLWAKDEKEANKLVLDIINENKGKSVVKSKSMTTEETELNDYLEKNGKTVYETDLGEFIVQQADEKPYHIVTPAMHKSKEDVADLYHEKFNTPKDADPNFLTDYTRGVLREEFYNADIGITGANFLLADTGAICLTENEGNAVMSIAFPKTHIAIAGIEKILPSIDDLDLFWSLLSTMGTGQKITVYNSIISGAKKTDEDDGPEKMYLILLDNGRTNLLKQKEQKLALKCIRCGACLNYCPIYQTVGGYTYDATYSGPIGSVISPFYKGFKEYNHLSFASTLCGKCTEVCPVKIPLHHLLLLNRRDAVNKGYQNIKWKIGINIITNVFLRRKLLNLPNHRILNFFVGIVNNFAVGNKRKLPKLKKSFNKRYKKMDS